MYLRGTVIGKKISGIEISGTIGDTNASAYGISVITNSKVIGTSSGVYIDGNIGDTSTYGIYVNSNGKIKGSNSGIMINGDIGHIGGENDTNSTYGILINGTVKGSDSGIYLNGTVGDINNSKFGI